MLKYLMIIINRKATLSACIGIGAFFGGIFLAYFTLDSEPWGTIGGFVCALG